MIVDLIIPALNEAANIAALFDELDPLRERRIVRHIILADNGSTDETRAQAAARGAIVVIEPRRGYGGACLKAIAWIAAQPDPPDVVAFIDADLSDDPAALPTLLEPLLGGRAEADLVIGSRVQRALPGALNFVQRFGNGLACILMRMLTGRRHTDLGPLRAVRWTALQELDMRDRTWGWTVEMQMKAALLDIPAAEVNVPYRRRAGGRSKISGTISGVTRAGTKIISTIVALWWRRRRIRARPSS